MGDSLTAGDLALIENRRGYGDGYGCGYGHHGRGMAATGIALGASGLGIAVFGGLALAFGLNAASKARARGAENQANANAKTVELLAATMNREATRQDGVNIDVQQTLRSQAYTSAYGGGANAASNALATAEAQALLQNGGFGNGLNSAIGGCNYLRVARVSGSRLCGCDGCNGDI